MRWEGYVFSFLFSHVLAIVAAGFSGVGIPLDLRDKEITGVILFSGFIDTFVLAFSLRSLSFLWA